MDENETFQVSDWSKRPLSEHQIVYAALDAHVLIELYDEFERLAAKEDNDPFFRSTAELMFDNKNKVDTSKLKKKVKKVRLRKEKGLWRRLIREVTLSRANGNTLSSSEI